jgi:hypothetical protein
MKTLIFLIAVILTITDITSSQVSQQWVSRFDGSLHSYDYASYITVDPMGNVYTAGESDNSSTGYDLLTCKFNSAGVLQWSKTYTAPVNRNDHSFGIKSDQQGNVYMTGEVYTSAGQSEIVTIKYNTQGEQVWLRSFNGTGNYYDSPRDITIDNQCNVYITGFTYNTGAVFDMVTIKYDSAGTQLWAALVSATGYYAQGNSITVDGTGNNIYVAGYYMYDWNTQSREMITVKYNSMGDSVWVRKVRGASGLIDAAVKVITDRNGNIFVGGSTQNVGNRSDGTVVKYSPSGVEQWVNKNNVSGQSDNLWELACDSAGNIYSGSGKGWTVSNDFMLQKLNPASGIIEWTRVYDGGGDDAIGGITVDNSGFIYVTGSTTVPGMGYNAVTMKYNSAGVKLWEQQYNNSNGNGNDQARELTIDNQGNVFVCGISFNTGTSVDAIVIKYSQGITTGIHNSNETPDKYELFQNYPNPFNPITNIKFSMPKSGHVRLKVYDILGKLVAELVNEFKPHGNYLVDFSASDLASGVYFYRLETDDFTDVKKMVLVK